MTSKQVQCTIEYIRLMNRKKFNEGLSQSDLDNLNLILDNIADTFPYKWRDYDKIGLGYESESRLGDWIKTQLHNLLGI